MKKYDLLMIPVLNVTALLYSNSTTFTDVENVLKIAVLASTLIFTIVKIWLLIKNKKVQ